MRTTRNALTGFVLMVLLLVPAGVAAQDDDAGDDVDAAALLPYAAVNGMARGANSGGATFERSDTVPELRATGYQAVVTVTTNDPRLSGKWTGIQNYHQFREGEPGDVRAGIARLVNDGGAWAVTFTGFTPPGVPNSISERRYHMLLSGEGGYEGLSAVLVLDPTGPAAWQLDGLIFPGPVPEFPPASSLE